MWARPLVTILTFSVLLVAIAQATWLGDVVHILARQVTRGDDDGTTTLTRSTTPSTTGPSTTPSSRETTPSTTAPPSTTPSSTPPSTTPSTSDDPPVTSDTRTDTTPAPTPTDSSSSTERDSSTPEESVTTLPPSTRTTVVVVTENGETRSSTSEIVETPVITNPASLNGGNSNGGSSGMSSSTRNTIIGVVVGIGGAILLGALGFVAWRIRGRRQAGPPPDDDLMAGTAVGATSEKPDGSGNKMFTDNLERHHAQPTTTATNF